MISLTSLAPVSRGAFRTCYVHPDDDSRCIKVPHGKPRKRGRSADPNVREWAEYQRLLSAGAPVQRYFAEIYGPVETDLGPGLCVERLRGAQGEGVVPRIIDAAIARRRQGQPVEPILDGLRELVEFCIEYEVMAACEDLKNVGVVRRNGAEAIVGYDLKGLENKEFIPISTYFSYFRRRKIARRLHRMVQAFERTLDKAARKSESVGAAN